jgi:demethylmenaquinone methyltransferase / 2-methoxy-6-polyprenyl-1,4-benzoquinol methylase
MSVLPQVEEKAGFVQGMFAAIAGRYDLMNRLMTFGLDQGWRRYAARAVAQPGVERALDVGTGTGDFLVCLAHMLPDAQVVGADFTREMMVAGLPKIAPVARTAFVCGDALALPFPDASFDALTTGFTVRNVTDIVAAFREMCRVVRPGGRMACLEVARPRSALVRLGHRIYFSRVVPVIGALVGGNRLAYTYLPQSSAAFPQPERLAELMRAAGWREVRYRLLGMGAVAVHVATK